MRFGHKCSSLSDVGSSGLRHAVRKAKFLASSHELTGPNPTKIIEEFTEESSHVLTRPLQGITAENAAVAMGEGEGDSRLAAVIAPSQGQP